MFPNIFTRETICGEEPHVAGTRLRVWQVVMLYRALGEDMAAAAEYLELEPALVDEAVRYALCHPDEIEPAILEQEEMTERAARGELPGVEVLMIPDREQ